MTLHLPNKTGRTQSKLIVPTLLAGMLLVVPGLTSAQQDESATQNNGIVVGQAKLYDERTLEQMLGQVQHSLGGADFINPTNVSQDENTLQGATYSADSFSADLSRGRFPSTSGSGSTSSGSSGSTSSSGSAAGGSSGGSSSSGGASPASATAAVKLPAGAGGGHGGAGGSGGGGGGQEAETANLATLSQPYQTSGGAVGGSLAVAPEDLLQQQVGLSFQAANISLLLQHALSDRVIFENGKGVTRSIAILGFPITIEPSDSNKNEVAEADITVTSPSAMAGPEVDMMLPQDKTYNVAKVTNNSRSIGLGAFAQPILGSAGASSSRSSSFVVYDIDTVALQRPCDGNPQTSVTFGWQFRPVLGQKAVQAGTRQVYVVLSLPVDATADYLPQLSVHTYWKKLDTKAGVISGSDEESPSEVALPSLPVNVIGDYDAGLQPVVDQVDWHDAGSGQVLVEAMGRNFTHSTAVVVDGQAIHVEEQGGTLLRFIAPVEAIQYDDPLIIGDYGMPVPIVQPTLEDNTGKQITPDDSGEGFQIGNISYTHPDANDTDISIQLVGKRNVSGSDGGTPPPPELPQNAQLVVSVGGVVYGLNDSPIYLTDEAYETPGQAASASPSSGSYPTLDVVVPNQILRSAHKLTVRYLFTGGSAGYEYCHGGANDYRDDISLPAAAFEADSVQVISKNGKEAVLAIEGDLHQTLQAWIKDKVFTAVINPGEPFLRMTSSQDSAQAGGKGQNRGGASTQATSTTAQFKHGLDIASSGASYGPFKHAAVTRGPVPATRKSPAQPAPEADGQSYSLALLTCPYTDIQGAEYVVLYEAGEPPQMLSLADATKDVFPPKPPKATPTPQASLYPYVTIGMSNQPAAGSASAAPAATSPPAAAQFVIGGSTTTGQKARR